MKKQNVKLTLLASLLTGLLSQGAMAAPSGQGTTIIFSADVSKTTCDVSSTANGGAASGVVLQDLGTFNKTDIASATNVKPVGAGNYNLVPSTTAPLVLTVSNCSGEDLASSDELMMSATGSTALDITTPATANDLYGSSSADKGYGFALGYKITDNSTPAVANNNLVNGKTGFIVPSTGQVPIYKASATTSGSDLADMNVSVEVAPQVAGWAATSAKVQDGVLDTNVTFSVAMN